MSAKTWKNSAKVGPNLVAAKFGQGRSNPGRVGAKLVEFHPHLAEPKPNLDDPKRQWYATRIQQSGFSSKATSNSWLPPLRRPFRFVSWAHGFPPGFAPKQPQSLTKTTPEKPRFRGVPDRFQLSALVDPTDPTGRASSTRWAELPSWTSSRLVPTSTEVLVIFGATSGG